MSSEFMLIIPASDQPLWQLKKELQDLGGARGDSFSPVPTSGGRYGYQVTPELYEAWQKAAGVQRVEADAPEPDAQADGAATDAAAAEQAGDGAQADAAGAEETQAAETDESGDAPQPAQGDTQSRKSKRAAQRSEQGKE